jgi:hypothetical protein
MAHGVHEEDKTLSLMLREVAAQADGEVSVADVVEHFGKRALAAVLFLFCVLNLLPWPPGGTTITGTPLLIVAVQVAIGVRVLWLPKAILRRGIDAKLFQKGLDKLLPWLERLERLSRPRLGFLFGPIGDRAIGLVITLLSLIIVLPITGGNLLPALAATVLSVSMVQRDGLLAVAGYALVVVSAGVLFLFANIIIEGAQRAWLWMQHRV